MLGQRIALLRHQAGLSQSALAARLDISPSAVGMYEQGRREPSLDILLALSRLFGVSTDYLLTGHLSDPRDVQALEQLLLRRLEQAQQRRGQGLTTQELTVLLAAALLE